MTFNVYELQIWNKKGYEKVTDKYEWYVNRDRDLFVRTDDIDNLLEEADSGYYCDCYFDLDNSFAVIAPDGHVATNESEWYIRSDGILFVLTENVDNPLKEAEGYHYEFM